ERGTRERQSCEDATGVRVRVHPGVESLVGCRGGLTANRAGRHGDIGAEGQLAAGDALDALAGSEDQHQIRLLHAPLEAEAAARQGHENRAREVAACISHDEDTMTTLAAEEERNLGEL